jgi:probable selenium-dependent hydroxylase accessory protein YqeC
VVEPIGIDGLAIALGLGGHEHVALVGGGGKTTALFALGNQLDGSVVLTTTTKMGRARTGGRPVLFSPSASELAAVLDRDRVALAWGADGGHKAVGVEPELCDDWFAIADHVVVEADGSRRRPFKAPRTFEPVVPATATMVVACVGSDALGRVIADQCHRPMRVAAIAGCSPYVRLTAPRLAAVLRSERGSRKGCPAKARFAVMVNRVTEREAAFVDELSDILGDDVPVVAVSPFDANMSPETGGFVR